MQEAPKTTQMFNYRLTAHSIRTGMMVIDKLFEAPAYRPEVVDRKARDLACRELPYTDTFRVTVYRVDPGGKYHQIDRYLVS